MAGTRGGLTVLAESIADAVENATTEILYATQLNCIYIFIPEKLFQTSFQTLFVILGTNK